MSLVRILQTVNLASKEIHMFSYRFTNKSNTAITVQRITSCVSVAADADHFQDFSLTIIIPFFNLKATFVEEFHGTYEVETERYLI